MEACGGRTPECVLLLLRQSALPSSFVREVGHGTDELPWLRAWPSASNDPVGHGAAAVKHLLGTPGITAGDFDWYTERSEFGQSSWQSGRPLCVLPVSATPRSRTTAVSDLVTDHQGKPSLRLPGRPAVPVCLIGIPSLGHLSRQASRGRSRHRRRSGSGLRARGQLSLAVRITLTSVTVGLRNHGNAEPYDRGLLTGGPASAFRSVRGGRLKSW